MDPGRWRRAHDGNDTRVDRPSTVFPQLALLGWGTGRLALYWLRSQHDMGGKMAETYRTQRNATEDRWLHVANEAPQLDPRQKFTIKSLKSKANVEALEDSVAELNETLKDIQKIRNFCATLPRTHRT